MWFSPKVEPGKARGPSSSAFSPFKKREESEFLERSKNESEKPGNHFPIKAFGKENSMEEYFFTPEEIEKIHREMMRDIEAAQEELPAILKAEQTELQAMIERANAELPKIKRAYSEMPAIIKAAQADMEKTMQHIFHQKKVLPTDQHPTALSQTPKKAQTRRKK